MVDLSADDPPVAAAISVYNNNVSGRAHHAQHPQFRLKKNIAKQSRLITTKRRASQQEAVSQDGVYRVVVRFHLTDCNLLDDVIQYLRTRVIGKLQYPLLFLNFISLISMLFLKNQAR